MENPLAAIRKKKGLTVADMGVLAGVSTMTIQRIEKGVLSVVTPEVLNTVEQMGCNREQFQADYDEWKSHKVKELKAKIS